ncbi:hypothetical protein TYRP_022275 [Tyrophagus putrescentiae]|nr:hypothetical protein TYRP_022275 [Tyrophagus putrescentiae]
MCRYIECVRSAGLRDLPAGGRLREESPVEVRAKGRGEKEHNSRTDTHRSTFSFFTLFWSLRSSLHRSITGSNRSGDLVCDDATEVLIAKTKTVWKNGQHQQIVTPTCVCSPVYHQPQDKTQVRPHQRKAFQQVAIFGL